ncbi:MAG TPA: glycosyl hydrolase family 8, partial [Paludibacteraceae bacterium]|nr:glycosyl hydrolase family 8 [Paludibacteraceae bacterium]
MHLNLKVIAASLSLLCANAANAVDVYINSGNPAFPFPQFLEYSYGTSHSLDNLGTKNPEGVVHVEMEQDIRDAYQIFANEWEYSGETMDGVQYIRGNIGCPYDCREGDGYSMLAAAVMGDKESFDGLWFRIHDRFRPTSKSYLTGQTVPDGGYGDLIIGDQANSCSATDGDNEVVLALYVAWRQWGDDSGHTAADGSKISYKKDLIDVVRGLVAIYDKRFPTENPRRCTTGDVGIDGYLKNGTTWAEVTNWGGSNPVSINGVDYIPEFAGPVNMHTDYSSPAYFKEFYDLILELDVPESTPWEREQYRRCEASCDWMVGNWMQQSAKNLFFGEEATIAGGQVTLEAGNQGGRFRSAWRTALNYVWHGDPNYTWNPTTHKVESGGNTFEQDWCKRCSEFVNDPQGWLGTASCTNFGGGPEVTYKGPATIHWDVQPDGTFPESAFTLNWVPATSMPAAIGAQDLDLAGLLYRQCDIEWDVTDGGDGYLSSTPHYFHGFFRWLGMLIATGNHIAPSQMKAGANMKIYRAIKDSVTCCYTGDELTYILDYRNFGSLDAKDVVIVENVPKDFVFVSASNGGVYNPSTHTVTWKIGTVPGVKSDAVTGPGLDLTSGNLAKTIGQVSYSVKVGPEAFGRYCTTADITCSNGSGWTSNEYPNYITATMQRNCVDVIKRALLIEKTADIEKVNPGNIVTYTINFENSSKAGWLDGGRPRVSLAMSNDGLATTQEWLRFRLYNDAIEPYINYGNYRLSYFLYDSNLKCLDGTPDCPMGWGWYTAIYEGKRTPTDKVTVSHETIVEGSDEQGKWNQRMVIQFAPLLVTTTAHLSNYYGMGARIHRGGTEPLRVAGYIYPSNWAATDFADDWSWDAGAKDAEDGFYYPVTPSWQKIDNVTGKSIETPVTEYLPSVCETPSHTISNVLVEEYDGYVWRRVLGNGPMPGREANNVVVIDTLPKGMTFVAFKNSCPLTDYGASWNSYQIADGRWVVKWEIPVMQVKQKGSIIYTAEANFPSGAECQTDDELTTNLAWIKADKNSPLSDTAEVTVTCAKVPKPIIPTTLVKKADKEKYEVGDPITYTIEYEQTHGFITENALSKSSDWELSGSSISNASIDIPNGSSAKYKYSYAKNIYVEMNCDVTQYASGEIFLRDDIRLDYKSDWSDITFTCYEGASLKKSAKVVTNSTKFKLTIEVMDDVLRLWFNKDTTNSADYTVENLNEKSGYFGFNGIEAGSFKYSDIYVHTDYAYDLSIIDRKPAEVSYISADNGGKLDGDSIVWKFEQGLNNPIPFGTKYTVSWDGKVDQCNESIINIAYAKLLGHADDEIMAQAVSECGSVDCSLDTITISVSK